MTAADPKEYHVICQAWLESEAGWGQRPDGASLHLSSRDLEQYLKDYMKDRTGPAPHEYDRPAGSPSIIRVSREVYLKVQKRPPGIRIWQDEYREIRAWKPEAETPKPVRGKKSNTNCVSCKKAFTAVPKGTRDSNVCVFCSEKQAIAEIQTLKTQKAEILAAIKKYSKVRDKAVNDLVSMWEDGLEVK